MRDLTEKEPLRINGNPTSGWTRVNLDDLVLAGQLLINVRTLVVHPLLERELFSLAGGNAQYRIGNQFEHDITIDDDLDRTWSCEIEPLDDKGSFRIKAHTCPYPIYLNNALIKGNVAFTEQDRIRIQNHIIFWDAEEQHFEKVQAGFSRLRAQGLEFSFKTKPKGWMMSPLRCNGENWSPFWGRAEAASLPDQPDEWPLSARTWSGVGGQPQPP